MSILEAYRSVLYLLYREERKQTCEFSDIVAACSHKEWFLLNTVVVAAAQYEILKHVWSKEPDMKEDMLYIRKDFVNQNRAGLTTGRNSVG